jgi:hypothetical protein
MTKQPNYLPKLVAAAIQQKPGLNHVFIAHDERCDLLKGKGPCNCNPEVSAPLPHSDYIQRN